MDFFSGDLFEFPGALFRKLFTARDKSFDEILKDETKNKLTGVGVAVILVILIFLLIIII
ncbi:MAG: hypothetical protein ACXWWC_09285 [Chitinophagaceae bacterium]